MSMGKCFLQDHGMREARIQFTNCALSVDIPNMVFGIIAIFLAGGGIWATIWAARKYLNTTGKFDIFPNGILSKIDFQMILLLTCIQNATTSISEKALGYLTSNWVSSKKAPQPLLRTKTNPTIECILFQLQMYRTTDTMYMKSLVKLSLCSRGCCEHITEVAGCTFTVLRRLLLHTVVFNVVGSRAG
jgi:hypothetical protein